MMFMRVSFFLTSCDKSLGLYLAAQWMEKSKRRNRQTWRKADELASIVYTILTKCLVPLIDRI